MRRFLTSLFLLLICCTVAFAQSMTDDQVVTYLTQAQRQGVSQANMVNELMRKGVTREQLMRVRQQIEKEKNAQNGMNASDKSQPSRMRDANATSQNDSDKKNKQANSLNGKQPGSVVGASSALSGNAEDDQTMVLFDKDGNPMQVSILYDELGNPIATLNSTAVADMQIFGHSYFTNKDLTFEPNANIATPENYRLGPGDEVIIDIWGASENTIRGQLTPEGDIQISGLGPVHLGGMTVKAANAYLQRELAKIYAGIETDDATSSVQLTLGSSRSILINVMGEVTAPGTYTLSAFSSVFHALYAAGGVNNIGSLRSIKVRRGGRTVADVDVYNYIMNGQMTDDVRLQEGDVIYVEPYAQLVQVTGKVKRPMFYEMKANETAKTLLEYAGGFTGDAYKKALRLIRKTGREMQVHNIDEMDYSVFRLEDGDKVEVDSVLTRYENRVEIRGAVYREGIYQLNGQMNTVKELIKRAEGLRGDAFIQRAVLDREKDNYDHEIVAVDVEGIMSGRVTDIPLHKNDVLYIPSVQNLKSQETVSIHGQVANPGTYIYAERLSVEDLIIIAGGLLDDAATIRVDITRRLKDPKSNDFSSELGQTFSHDLVNGLSVDNDPFQLMPYDEVYIRKSPKYQVQQNVTVTGEVLFEGTYALQNKNERLSSLIARAGGVTPDAYVKGARLLRKMTPDEMRRQMDLQRMAANAAGTDSLKIEEIEVDEYYTVGINLEKALEKPNSDYDVVLRDSDMLVLPQYVSTVKVSGAVMYPNTVLYKKGAGVRYYISQAGGFGNLARRSKAYVVLMNGTVAKLNSRTARLIEPGSEIIVPSKDPKDRMSFAQLLSLGTTTASLAAMVASIIRLM